MPVQSAAGWWVGLMARFEIPEGWTAQAFRFALDPTAAQLAKMESHCGAAHFAFNHMLGVVKAHLDQRAAERSYGGQVTQKHSRFRLR